LLLLDEPSAGLAQAEVSALATVIQRVRSTTGATIVIVEHDKPLVMGLADEVAVLDAGRLVAVGPPDRIPAISGAKPGLSGGSGPQSGYEPVQKPSTDQPMSGKPVASATWADAWLDGSWR